MTGDLSPQAPLPEEDVAFTHKGWMLFCPVKLGALDTEAPIVGARWTVLDPLFWLAELVQSCVIGVCSFCNPDYEPQWYFVITGELS